MANARGKGALVESGQTREMHYQLSGGGKSLEDFMRASPLYEQDDIYFDRDRSPCREMSFDLPDRYQLPTKVTV